MCHNENDLSIPHGYRLIDETTLSFLWFQTAGITLHHFGVNPIPSISDAERIDSVERLGRLYLENEDILPEEAQLVMDYLIGTASQTEGSEHHP